MIYCGNIGLGCLVCPLCGGEEYYLGEEGLSNRLLVISLSEELSMCCVYVQVLSYPIMAPQAYSEFASFLSYISNVCFLCFLPLPNFLGPLCYLRGLLPHGHMIFG